MEILKIKGFKCFSNNQFNLRNITVLAGANGAGKSSLIQSLLLTRTSIEKQCYLNDGWYEKDDSEFVKVPLNSDFKLELGTESDVIKDDESNKENVIKIALNDDEFDFVLNNKEDDVLSLKSTLNFSIDTRSSIRKKEFYYLNAERLGPRHTLENCYMPFLHCGHSGEYSAHVIDVISRMPTFKSATLSNDKKFKVEFDKWIEAIFPGICITANPISNLKSQITVSNAANKSEQLATNIGFGISYALPIIVNGLVANSESLFIIENPEAHLHPKAQSTIGHFLGYIASCGVKVLIETHSEHIINGLRKAILLYENLNEDQFNIYFFEGFINQVLEFKEIHVDKNSNLSLFPVDFFDQVRQDLSEIRNLTIPA